MQGSPLIVLGLILTIVLLFVGDATTFADFLPVIIGLVLDVLLWTLIIGAAASAPRIPSKW